MQIAVLAYTVLLIHTLGTGASKECARSLNPNDYAEELSSFSMPYVGSIPIPSNVPIKPSPVVTTKVINIVTKYVYKNPVCVKTSGKEKKTLCKPRSANVNVKNLDYLITKEYFVNHIRNWDHFPFKTADDYNRAERRLDEADLYVEASESPRPFAKSSATPVLSTKVVKDLLIEDRLNQLETLLPNYTRRRVYETSTITVTKVKSNNRATATLLVKNCIPQGFTLCPLKLKKRKSKVARYTNETNNYGYFG